MIKNIGDKITVTFASGTVLETEVTGRNWFFENLSSYIVRVKGNDYTVNPDNMKIQQSWGI